MRLLIVDCADNFPSHVLEFKVSPRGSDSPETDPDRYVYRCTSLQGGPTFQLTCQKQGGKEPDGD